VRVAGPNRYHGPPVKSAHADSSPLFRIFFQGRAAGLMSREATMLLMAPRGSVVAVVDGAASGTKHIWGIGQRPFAKARRLRPFTPDPSPRGRLRIGAAGDLLRVPAAAAVRAGAVQPRTGPPRRRRRCGTGGRADRAPGAVAGRGGADAGTRCAARHERRRQTGLAAAWHGDGGVLPTAEASLGSLARQLNFQAVRRLGVI
jgi:hypothetical protein